MKKQNSLILITILGLLAIFANVSAVAEESESEYSNIQVESSDESGTVTTAPAYVSDDEEEESTTTSSAMEEDTSTDSDI